MREAEEARALGAGFRHARRAGQGATGVRGVPAADFTTPTVYTQTVSALGLEEPLHTFRLIIVISIGGSPIPPAWMFDLCTINCPTRPCQPPGRVSTLLAGTACDTIPGLQVNARLDFGPITGPFFVSLVVSGTADGSFKPDPGRRYTLIRIAFDHAQSVAGPGGPSTCGGATDPFSFETAEFYWNGVEQPAQVVWDNCTLTWNSSVAFTKCPLVTPVRNRTWGQIKTLYR
jgi:hypothetical protein